MPGTLIRHVLARVVPSGDLVGGQDVRTHDRDPRQRRRARGLRAGSTATRADRQPAGDGQRDQQGEQFPHAGTILGSSVGREDGRVAAPPRSSSTIRRPDLEPRAEEETPGAVPHGFRLHGCKRRLGGGRARARRSMPTLGASERPRGHHGMRLFVTGAAGFIGSNYVRHVLATTDDEVTVFDALTYAGNLENLRGLDDDPRFTFVKGDITDRDAVTAAMDGHDAVVHFAAESHVDRSIVEPRRVRAHELRRHQRDVRRRPPRRRRPVPAHLHRRGVRLDRGGLVHRDRPARAPLAVLARRRPART